MGRGESDMDTPTSDCGWHRGGGLRARSGPTGAPAGTGSSSRALRTSRRPHFRHFPGNSFHVGRIAHTASVRFDENRGRPAAATAAQARSVPRLRPGAHRRPQGRRLSPSTPPGAPARRARGIAREAWLLARAFCVRSVSRVAGGPAAGPRPERVHPAACVSCVVPAPSPAPHGRDASAPACTPAPRSHTGFDGEVPTRSVKSAPKRLFAFYFDAIVVRVLDFIFHVFAARVQKSNDHLSDFRSRERPGPTRYSVVVFFQLLLLYGLPRDDGRE